MELWTFGGSLSTRSFSSRLLTLLILLALNLSSSTFPSSSGLRGDLFPESLCDLTHCWDLYQSAQESLRIHDDYPPPKLRSVPSEDIILRCIAYRTFFLCLRNMSRTCLGDLNFHSSYKGIEKQMKAFSCNVSGRVFEPASADSRTHLPVCSFAGLHRTYGHCSIFGDPHVRTFGNTFQTCRMQGAWPLIDNDYITVQVTSERVGTGEGTAISKVTVLVKRHDDCALDQYVSYQAASNDLPATFDDGQTSFGRADSVTIRELKPNRHVEIYVRYIDTTIVVRLQNRYFAVSLRMPQEIVNDTSRLVTNPLQLCLVGCPSRERIDIRRIIFPGQSNLPHRTAVSVDDALPVCQGLGLVDYYLDSCVFDLITTGDSNFTVLSKHAFADAILLLPEAGSLLRNRTTLPSSARSNFPDDYLPALVIISMLIVRTFCCKAIL